VFITNLHQYSLRSSVKKYFFLFSMLPQATNNIFKRNRIYVYGIITEYVLSIIHAIGFLCYKISNMHVLLKRRKIKQLNP